MNSENPLSEDQENLLINDNKTKFKKITLFIVPTIILIISFTVGFIYFFNFEVIAKYMIQKEGYPVEIDKLEIHLSGNFNMERLRYTFQTRQGISDQIKVEYTGGEVSIFKLLFSKNLESNINIRSVKVPFKDGLLSAGSWNILSNIKNIQKNTQQWDGTVKLTVKDAMIQYKMMNSNYIALIKTGNIKGHIINSIYQLEPSEILTDIAKITLTGNVTIVYPYNINIQLNILPLEEFSNKYPEEKNMLNALMQKNPNIIINLTGTIDNLNPQIQNLQN
ncbi:MAG: hypothetical protein OEV78_01060 [Spirochaetia bacterium]|nr:hypothetical protein [Spirochaetia bacterium]